MSFFIRIKHSFVCPFGFSVQTTIDVYSSTTPGTYDDDECDRQAERVGSGGGSVGWISDVYFQ